MDTTTFLGQLRDLRKSLITDIHGHFEDSNLNWIEFNKPFKLSLEDEGVSPILIGITRTGVVVGCDDSFEELKWNLKDLSTEVVAQILDSLLGDEYFETEQYTEE